MGFTPQHKIAYGMINPLLAPYNDAFCFGS